MAQYRYLILGGGMTADAAVRGIRELDADGSIGLIGAEEDPPYARPPLTKALWKGDPLDSVWKKTEEAGVDLHLGRRATGIDLKTKTVTERFRHRIRLRQAVDRDRRVAAQTAVRPGGSGLLPHSRRLPAPPRVRGSGQELRGDRRGFHRRGDRGGACASGM